MTFSKNIRIIIAAAISVAAAVSCKKEITFDELAALAGTISYELVCLVGKRVPRVCRRGGKVVQVFDYLDYQESSLE